MLIWDSSKKGTCNIGSRKRKETRIDAKNVKAEFIRIQKKRLGRKLNLEEFKLCHETLKKCQAR